MEAEVCVYVCGGGDGRWLAVWFPAGMGVWVVAPHLREAEEQITGTQEQRIGGGELLGVRRHVGIPVPREPLQPPALLVGR